MKKVNIFYFFVIVLAALIEISFLPAVFSFRPLPDLSLMLIIAATIIAGFKTFLPWTVFAGILHDLIFYGRFGSRIIFLVGVAYFVSFFSRRFLIENKFWGSIVMTGFVVIITIAHRLFLVFMDLLLVDSKKNGYFIQKITTGLPIEILLNLTFFAFWLWFLKRQNKAPAKPLSA